MAKINSETDAPLGLRVQVSTQSPGPQGEVHPKRVWLGLRKLCDVISHYNLDMLLTALTLIAAATDSGLKLGEFMPAYEPSHISGPDKGTKTCPVCKYGDLPAVQVWVNGDSDANVKSIISKLEAKVASSKHKLKAFVVFMTDGTNEATFAKKWAGTTQKVAIATIAKDSDAAKNYEVNLAAKNTVFVYKDMKLKTKFVDFTADTQGLNSLSKAISQIDR